MRGNVSCVLPYADGPDFESTLAGLKASGFVTDIFAFADNLNVSKRDGLSVIEDKSVFATSSLKKIMQLVQTDFVMFYTKKLPLQLGYNAVNRFIDVCRDCSAGMVYSDYFEVKGGVSASHPVIEYQDGSLRDDFDFGSITLYPSALFKQAVAQMDNDYEFAGLYDLRLRISQTHRIVRIPEFLYTEMEVDARRSGEKMFDYVDPRNRIKQIEMELACTSHLEAIGGYLAPRFKPVGFSGGVFDVEASVIIPVKNRVKTIGDAIDSVLKQIAPFPFNLIVVDNHSTDGTTELVDSYAKKDSRVVHLLPSRRDLGIGGCWNEGIDHRACGKFAVQLDSDDLYIDGSVLARIVDAFYDQNCAMVVGSYQMVNYNLEEIPPGLIDHKEWTPENGRNNALRINGLGAPRAFFTPVLREIGVPNVSYGEDYALGLRISREYQIGRIYDPLYLCRRWEGNSDAALDIEKLNNHNFYKDKIRTMELWARQKSVAKQK